MTSVPLEKLDATVLVVDPDPVSSRFVELALGQVPGLRVEGAREASSAIEILNNSLVDLVICETVLPDAEGTQFCRRLQRERRYARIPVLFLSADTKVVTKLSAFAVGAADYLTKPIDAQELRARVVGRIQADKAVRQASLSRNYVLAGDFTGMPFTDLVNLLHLSRSGGVLSIVTPRAAARLFFESGSLVHATFGNLDGPQAVYALMFESTGQFEFSRELHPPDARTIDETPTALLMEGTRLLDTARASGLDSLMTVDPAKVEARSVVETSIVPTPTPDSALAAQVAATVGDSFSLGELRLCSEAELAAYTRGTPTQKRLHAFLIAELAAGVSAMMSIASPLSEREILAGLATTNKVLTLSFHLRRDRQFDLVLLDVHRPAQFLRSLARAPGFIVLAPPSGDFLMSVESRAQLELLLTQLTPTALLGVGNASLEAGWIQLEALRDRKIRVQCERGSVGEGGADMRQTLGSGLRLWGTGDAQGDLLGGPP